MATFTMPPTTNTRDPNLLPKREGVDYTARADEAWREIEDHLLTIADTEAAYLRVEGRVADGQDWLQGNKGHERYMEAYQAVNELRNEATNLAINLRSLRRVVWNNVLVLYACLSHIDRDGWQARHGVVFETFSPEGIWSQLSDHEQPGSYPAEKREQWLERKVNYVGWTAR